MIKIDAENVIKTIDWIAQTDEDPGLVIEPTINGKGIYECLIHLPIIEKKVIGIGDTKIESIDNATRESSKLIDEYMSKNPNHEVKSVFASEKYELIEDDKGYLSLRCCNRKLTSAA